MSTKIMLVCGVLTAVIYIAMNIYVPLLYPGYQVFSQTVSELSAIGAPTRSVWVVLMLPYSLLLTLFGWGVWTVSGGRRSLRVAGLLLIIDAVIGIFWPPMHTREVLAAGGGTITDTLHIVWTAITAPLMVFAVGFAGSALGKKFGVYSAFTIVVMILFGVLTGLMSTDMEKNLPTPWMGVWERISIGAFMVWLIFFAWRLSGRSHLATK